MSRFSMLFFATLAAAAKKVEEESGNDLVETVKGLVFDVFDASLDAAKDLLGHVLAFPRTLVDAYVWALGVARSVPDHIKTTWAGDKAQIDSLSSFAVECATIVFAVYMGLAALNLLANTFVSIKDYFQSYLVIPTSVFGQKLPEPIAKVASIIQKEVLDKIRTFRVKGWIVPLDGQRSAPACCRSLTVSCSAAVTVCMILSTTPAVLALMRGGANKGAAEAIAWTLGTALGLQYLVKATA